MKLYSYERIWKVEKKIYSIQNIHLPAPIKPVELGYFLLVAAIVFILGRILPFLVPVPPVLKYVVLPVGLTKFFMKKKLDGKSPPKFFIDYLIYLANRNNSREFFRIIERRRKKAIKLNWNCTSRYM